MRLFKSVLVAAVGVAAISSAAQATVITHTYDTKVTDSDSDASGNPVVTWDDLGASGTVILTIDLNPLTASEFISNFWFNFAGVDSVALTVTRSGGSGPTASFITINPVSEDAYNSAGNNGLFDGLIEFSTSNAGGGVRRFNGDETLVFTLTGLGIVASDFNVVSQVGGGSGDARIGQMHIQGLADGGSVHLSPIFRDVPEPGMLGLLGIGLVGLAVARRRR